MKFGVKHQDSYSRGELLLRSFFGFFYIIIPHMFVLLFVSIASSFVNMIAFWAILFTGKFPPGLFNFQLGVRRWNLRLGARLSNLSDGYPAFGINAEDPNTMIEMEPPVKSNRGTVLLRAMFGFIYVIIPHFFCLAFLMYAKGFVGMIAFWVILFTGKYPAGMHRFVVGVDRWAFRVGAYMTYMTDTYPPFSLKGDETDFNNTTSNSELLDQM